MNVLRVSFVLCGLVSYIAAANAQQSPVLTPPSLTNQSLSLGTGAMDANQFTIRGLNLGNISTATSARSVFLGNAGPAGTITGTFTTCVGDGACGSLGAATTLEMTAFGTGAAAAVTGGNGYSIAQGVSALRSETTANHVAALGGDSARNEIGSGFSVLVGDNSGRNGSTGFGVSVGSGAGAGSALIMTFGGTITVGDTLTLTLTTSGYATGLPLAYTYTTASGDTPQTVAQQFYNKINANISNVGCIFTPAGLNGSAAVNGAIALDFPGTPTAGCAITGALTGNTTETLTIGYSQWNQSVLVGGYAGGSAFAGVNNFDVLIGYQSGQNAVSLSQDVFAGWLAGQNATTESLSVFVGAHAGASQISWYNNVYVGANAGYSLNGGYNVVLGAMDQSGAQTCVSGVQFNLIIIGSDACPASNGSHLLVIGNAIYGTNIDGSVSTVSNSLIGINTKTPNAGLTIGQAGTSGGVTSDGHLGFLATTQPSISTGCSLDSTSTDSDGTITVASGTTSCTLTFADPFKTANRVTMGDYTVSTAQTKLASKGGTGNLGSVTWTVASGAKFDYHIFQ